MTLASLQEINSLNSLSPEERTQKERIIASHLLDVLKEVKPESGADRKELNTTTAERLGDYGYWPQASQSGKAGEFIEYEPDSELRDTEQVPLKEPGGIDTFFAREVLPHAPDAWIATDKTQIGYEISFARYFYKPAPLRTLAEIRTDILALERQSEGLLHKIVGGA